MTGPQVPTVVTDRLVLRGWRDADIDPYAAMNADPETMRHLGGTCGRTGTERLVDRARALWASRGHGMWAAEDRETGEFLGRAGTYWAPGWPGVEVAVSIRRDRWGQGLGTEAIRASLAWGFANLDVAELFTIIERDNVGMNRIAAKVGMRLVNDRPGMWRGVNTHAISRAEWEAPPRARRLTAEEAAAVTGPEPDEG
jgi:RimJ/RimL family protein N-acetyltransferase